jgi:hypothetical protein
MCDPERGEDRAGVVCRTRSILVQPEYVGTGVDMYLNRSGGVGWPAECDMATYLDCSGQHRQCSMKAHWTSQVVDLDEQQVDMQDEVHMVS